MSAFAASYDFALPTVRRVRADAHARTRLVLTAAAIVGLCFFLTGHDFKTSLAVAYTQSAEEMEIAAAGGNAVRRLAFLALALSGVGIALAAKSRVRVEPWLAASLMLLFCWTTISFIWADSPAFCLRRLFAFGCCAVASAGFARAFSLKQLCWMTLTTLSALATIGVLAEVALGTFKPWSGDYRFAGTVHPNTQGPALATLGLAAFVLAKSGGRWRGWLWFVFAGAMVLLLLTKSRTTAAATLLSLAIVALSQSKLSMRYVTALTAVWLATVGLWMVWVCGFDPLNDFRDAILLGRADESDTLSGRAFIWPEVLSFVEQRLWLGYGYEAFWTPAHIETISSTLGWGLREAHNAYLETLLSGGVVGLGLVLMVALSGLAAAGRGQWMAKDPAYGLPLGLLVFGLINAGLESGMVVVNLMPFLVGCFLMRMAFFRETEPAAI